MALEEVLSLDIRQAQANIDRIEAELTAAAQRFKVGLSDALGVLMRPTQVAVDATPVTTAIDDAVQAADTTIEPDDTSEITAGIDDAVAAADGTVPVESEGAESITADLDAAVDAVDGSVPVEAAGAGGITDEIDAAVAAADTTVEIDADASGLSAELDNVAGSAGAANSSLGGTEAALAGVEGAAGLAAGEAAGLTSILTALPGPAKAVAAAGVATAGVVRVLGAAALESDVAQRRFNTSLGQFAARLESVNIPGFADNLGELAERTGNSDEAMRLAIARMFDLGTSAGVAGERVSVTSEQVTLLALRASVLNPTLGDAGAIMETLTGALARGGRTLSDYGLSITAAEIETRALKDTGKATAEELTVYERSAAGAAIASERLKNKLFTDIVKGADQPAIAFRRLREEFGNTLEKFGEPLLDDVIEAAEAAQPAMLALAQIFGIVAELALPPLVKGLEVTADAMELVATGVEKVKGPLGLVGEVVTTAASPVSLLGDAIDRLFDDDTAPKIDKIVDAVSREAAAAAGAEEPNKALKDAVKEQQTAFDKLNEAIDEFNGRLDRALGVQLSAQEATSAFRERIDALRESVKENGTQVGVATEKQRNLGDALRSAIEAAQGEVEALTRSGKIAGDAASQKESLILRLLELKKTFPELAGPIETYIATVRAIPDEKTTTIKVDTTAATNTLEVFERLADRAARERVSVLRLTTEMNPGPGRAAPRQHGGRFRPGQLLEVGEAGREFVAFDTPGHVFSAADSDRIAAALVARVVALPVVVPVPLVAVAGQPNGVSSAATAGSVAAAGSAVTVSAGGALVKYELNFAGDVDRAAVAAGVRDSQPGVVGALEGLLGKIQSR